MDPYDKAAIVFMILLVIFLGIVAVRAMRRDSGVPGRRR